MSGDDVSMHAEVCIEHRNANCKACDEFNDDLWINPRDLPEEDEPPRWMSGDTDVLRTNRVSFGVGGPGCECCPPWVRDDDTGIEFSVDEAREYAAALLAAADAAEVGGEQG